MIFVLIILNNKIKILVSVSGLYWSFSMECLDLSLLYLFNLSIFLISIHRNVPSSELEDRFGLFSGNCLERRDTL